MKALKQKIKIMIEFLRQHRSATIIGLIIFLLFFWFGIRPAIIRSHCDGWAIKSIRTYYLGGEKLSDKDFRTRYFRMDEVRSEYESFYRQCLRKQGLKD